MKTAALMVLGVVVLIAVVAAVALVYDVLTTPQVINCLDPRGCALANPSGP